MERSLAIHQAAKEEAVKKADILTFQERKLYRFLSTILKKNYYVLAQVRLTNIVTIPANHFIWKRFIPLGSKCVDFVICDKVNGETKLVIELDDKTHEQSIRKRRDAYVDKVLANAGIPIIHQLLKNEYDEEELLELIKFRIDSFSKI